MSSDDQPLESQPAPVTKASAFCPHCNRQVSGEPITDQEVLDRLNAGSGEQGAFLEHNCVNPGGAAAGQVLLLRVGNAPPSA